MNQKPKNAQKRRKTTLQNEEITKKGQKERDELKGGVKCQQRCHKEMAKRFVSGEKKHETVGWDKLDGIVVS